MFRQVFRLLCIFTAFSFTMHRCPSPDTHPHLQKVPHSIPGITRVPIRVIPLCHVPPLIPGHHSFSCSPSLLRESKLVHQDGRSSSLRHRYLPNHPPPKPNLPHRSDHPDLPHRENHQLCRSERYPLVLRSSRQRLVLFSRASCPVRCTFRNRSQGTQQTRCTGPFRCEHLGSETVLSNHLSSDQARFR